MLFKKLNISAKKPGSCDLWEEQGARDFQQAPADTRLDSVGRTASDSVTGRHIYIINNIIIIMNHIKFIMNMML